MSSLHEEFDHSGDKTIENVLMRIRHRALTEAASNRTQISQLLAAKKGKQTRGSKSRPSVRGVIRDRRQTIAAVAQKAVDCDTVADPSTEFSIQCPDFPFVALTVVAGIDMHVPKCVLPGVVIEMCGMMRRRQGSGSARFFKIGPGSSIMPREIAYEEIEWMCDVYCCRSPDAIEVLRSLEHASLSSLAPIDMRARISGLPQPKRAKLKKCDTDLPLAARRSTRARTCAGPKILMIDVLHAS
jgi:hypothetical protein